MHGRARVGLGEVEQVGLERARPDRRRQLLEPARGRLVLAQDPQTGAGHRDQLQVGVLVGQLVLAIAEEGEVALLEPAEEGVRLGDLVRFERRRVAAQLRDEVERALAHLAPVAHCGAHLADHALEVSLQSVELGGVRVTDDLGVDHGLGQSAVGLRAVGEDLEQVALVVAPDLDDRMNDQVDAEVAVVQLHTDRVDQERHVVGDDLDRRVRPLPAVYLELRVVDPDLRRPRRALTREVEVRERRAVQVEVAALGDVVGGDPAVVLADERFGASGLVPAQVLAQPRTDGVDKGFVDIQDAGHSLPASLTSPAGPPGYQTYVSITVATWSAGIGPTRSSQMRPS